MRLFTQPLPMLLQQKRQRCAGLPAEHKGLKVLLDDSQRITGVTHNHSPKLLHTTASRCRAANEPYCAESALSFRVYNAAPCRRLPTTLVSAMVECNGQLVTVTISVYQALAMV